jgi:hypothetical protein
MPRGVDLDKVKCNDEWLSAQTIKRKAVKMTDIGMMPSELNLDSLRTKQKAMMKGSLPKLS